MDELLQTLVESYRSPRVHIARLEPCKIFADAEFLKKMFAAFLDNALRYSPPDKPVTVELKTSSDTATVKIIDRGIGIPVAERGKIFERFYRTDKARTKIDEGNSVGLGLSIAKWIADRHDIKIDVQSKSGEGSVFVLTIPTIESY